MNQRLSEKKQNTKFYVCYYDNYQKLCAYGQTH